MGLLAIAAHLDDAVFGCGELLTRTPGAQVITVLAGIPDSSVPVTAYDASSGFTSPRHAVTERRREDTQACAVLSAVPRHLDFVDHQYGVQNDAGEIVAALIGWLQAFPHDAVAIPVGIGHPDHEVIARCARAALRNVGPRYEELPYRVVMPGAIEEALLRISITEEPFAYQFDTSQWRRDLTRKRAAVACYRSQAWALDDTCCFVPERYWKIDVSTPVKMVDDELDPEREPDEEPCND